MKIAHLCCGIEGGADIAAIRIHRTLLSGGADSRYYHLDHRSPDTTFTKFNGPRGLVSTIKDRVAMYKNDWIYGKPAPDTEAFSDPVGHYQLTFDQLDFRQVDVITLHWVATFFDLEPFLKTVPSNVKFAWALHDLNPMTGGCHYASGCDNFKVECVSSPQLLNNGFIDRARRNFRIKKDVYDKYLRGRLHLIADSNWVADMARASKLLGAEPVSVVNYPIETDAFRYVGRDVARQALGLDPDKAILLFGSGAIDNKRKGMDLLIEAIRGLSDPGLLGRLELITFGSGTLGQFIPNVPIRNFGKVSASEFLTLLYNAADYFVMPSREEALGQTAMESVCCGTPVIAFPTGGIVDTVDASNGIFADAVSSNALRAAIETAFHTQFDQNRISQDARAKYSYSVKAKEYLRIYERLLSGL